MTIISTEIAAHAVYYMRHEPDMSNEIRVRAIEALLDQVGATAAAETMLRDYLAEIRADAS